MEWGIRQEEAAAAGHTWQALTEGKGLPEQDRAESQVARIEIPRPSLELGFTPVAMKMALPGSGGLGARLLSEKHPGAQCSEGAGWGCPNWGLSGQAFPSSHDPDIHVLPRGDIREGRRLAGGKLRQGGGCLVPFHGLGGGGARILGHSSSRPQELVGPGSSSAA